MAGYNSQGRPRVDVYQHGSPWTSDAFTVHTPSRVHRELNPNGVLGIIKSFTYRPVLQCQPGVCGSAKNYFRSKIAHMPLPEGLPQSP
jgi:hypothetical protein